MNRRVGDDELHAFVDGELDTVRQTMVEHWLAEHPEDAELVSRWRDQKAALHRLFDGVLDETTPSRMTEAVANSRRRRVPPWLLRIAAAVALMLVGGTGGWMVRGMMPVPNNAAALVVADEALSAHRVFVSEVRHPVEVPASDQAHLVAWLSKRLGTPLVVPDLSATGFTLMGGRLLPASDGPAAQFMYENAAGQRLTLYLRHNETRSETAFRFASQGGANVFYWLNGPFDYAVVGDLPREQLMSLANSVYRQLERSGTSRKTGP